MQFLLTESCMNGHFLHSSMTSQRKQTMYRSHCRAHSFLGLVFIHCLFGVYGKFFFQFNLGFIITKLADNLFIIDQVRCCYKHIHVYFIIHFCA